MASEEAVASDKGSSASSRASEKSLELSSLMIEVVDSVVTPNISFNSSTCAGGITVQAASPSLAADGDVGADTDVQIQTGLSADAKQLSLKTSINEGLTNLSG